MEAQGMDEGPSYLDFITPDDVFDKGPDAVREWQHRYVAALSVANEDTACPASSKSQTGHRAD